MSIDAAVDVFSKARPPGIYKQDYLDELVRLYPYEGLASLPAPERPEWCLSTMKEKKMRRMRRWCIYLLANSDDEDEPNERVGGGGPGAKRMRNPGDGGGNKRFREETTRVIHSQTNLFSIDFLNDSSDRMSMHNLLFLYQV